MDAQPQADDQQVDNNSYIYTMDAPVDVDHPPQRVVSLVPSVTESLFDLNLGDRVIAITDYCIHPAEQLTRLPRIGGTKNPDVARIIQMAPDLVIANREENRKEDVEALQAAGIPVWVTYPRTVREAFNLLWNIMYVFGVGEGAMAERVRAIEWSVDWLERLAENKEPCKVFVPIWNDPLMTFNADTYAHDLLRVCGGTNVFAERERLYPLKADLGQAEAYDSDDPRIADRDTRYPRVTLEEVVEAQPDIILLPTEPFPFTEEHIALFAELDVPAARTNGIIVVDGSLLTWHGTRIAFAVDALPGLFCPTGGQYD